MLSSPHWPSLCCAVKTVYGHTWQTYDHMLYCLCHIDGHCDFSRKHSYWHCVMVCRLLYKLKFNYVSVAVIWMTLSFLIFSHFCTAFLISLQVAIPTVSMSWGYRFLFRQFLFRQCIVVSVVQSEEKLLQEVILKHRADGLQMTSSPFSAKRGVPHWFSGKISPAFSSHIFYPEPPKKVKTSKLTPTQLFPACISSKTWRDMHRTKESAKAKATSKSIKPKQKVAICNTVLWFKVFL